MGGQVDVRLEVHVQDRVRQAQVLRGAIKHPQGDRQDVVQNQDVDPSQPADRLLQGGEIGHGHNVGQG